MHIAESEARHRPAARHHDLTLIAARNPHIPPVERAGIAIVVNGATAAVRSGPDAPHARLRVTAAMAAALILGQLRDRLQGRQLLLCRGTGRRIGKRARCVD